MGSFFEKIKQFMYGRNGVDKLTVFLMILYLVINIVASFIRAPLPHYILIAVEVAIAAFVIFRVLSKNLYRRQYENDKFSRIFNKENFSRIFDVKTKFHRLSIRLKQIGTHRFRTCPNCNEFLRISKKRGKRNITCPKCGREFDVRIIF